MKDIILTGDRPTGKLHLGHYVGSLKMRVEMQNSGEYTPYIMIADMQALTDNASNPKKIQDNLREVVLDYLSVGIDPKVSTIFVQSQIPELCELMFYFMNLVTVARLERNPTVKTEIKQKQFGKNAPVGFMVYPISQAADILGFNANIVPVGEDQMPMIEQAREIARMFNNTYGEVFNIPKGVVPSNEMSRRLPGIDGAEKMGKSLGNGIYLSDTPEEVRAKVMKMYTDPNHIKVSDPGKVEGNMVFVYLDVFGKDKQKIEELKQHYKKGGLGDVAVKRYLIEVLEEFLTPIREKRAYYEQNMNEVDEILIKGSKDAGKVVAGMLKKVRNAIGIEYFDN